MRYSHKPQRIHHKGKIVEDIQEIRHRDNQERFASIEVKLDKLLNETAYIREIGQDSEVFAKWMRRIGRLILWIGGIAIAVAAVFGLSKLGER
jgi:hypothetical protein